MRRFTIPSVLLIGILAAFLTGCSKSPVAPMTSVAMDGGAPSVGIQTDDIPPALDGGGAAEVTASFTQGDGGQLSVGRFTLDMHKNTLQMPATITMRISSADAMEVEIVVSPAEANDFQVPAQLTATMSDKPETDLQTTTMFYWEDAGWEASKAVAVQTGKQQLVAHMKHLSACRVADEANTAETAKQKK